MAIIGRYVLRPEIFSILQNLPPGKGGEIQLTDGLSQLVRERKDLRLRVSRRSLRHRRQVRFRARHGRLRVEKAGLKR